MKKIIIVLVVLAVIGGGAYFLLMKLKPASTNNGGQSNGASNVVDRTPQVFPDGVKRELNSGGEPTAAISEGILFGRAKPAPGATPNYISIQLAVSNSVTKSEVKRVTLGADGSYFFSLVPGEYILSIVKGTGSSDQLPQTISVGPGETIAKNFTVK